MPNITCQSSASSAPSIQETHPEVAALWNREKNLELGLNINKITKGSNKKAWFDCPVCGTASLVEVKGRTSGRRGCGICAGKLVRTGYNDLVTTHPTVAKEWDRRKNRRIKVTPDQVGYGSELRVWWKCSKRECKHSWSTQIRRRSQGSGCPKCAQGSVSKIEQMLFEGLVRMGQTAEQQHRITDTDYKFSPSINTDIFIPALNLVIEYDGSHWHSSDEVTKRDHAKTRAMLAQGYKVIRIRETSGQQVLPPLGITSDNLIQLSYEHSLKQEDVDELVTSLMETITLMSSAKS